MRTCGNGYLLKREWNEQIEKVWCELTCTGKTNTSKGHATEKCVCVRGKEEKESMMNEEVKGGERRKRDDSVITRVINKALNRCGA